MSALSTDDIFFVFSWQFAMLCTVPITSHYMRIGDNIWPVQFVTNPGRPVSPFFQDRGPLFVYRPPPWYSTVKQDVKSNGSPQGTSMGNGQFKELASAAKYYLDLVDEDNKLPSTSSREDRIVSGQNRVAHAVWIPLLERVVDGRTIYGITSASEVVEWRSM